jgi:hypothetical protein
LPTRLGPPLLAALSVYSHTNENLTVRELIDRIHEMSVR